MIDVNNEELELEGEIWKEHPIYNGYYGSNLGRIKYWHKREKCLKIKRQHIISGKYKQFGIKTTKNGNTTDKKIYTSRFIMECFEGINNSLEVDHIDSNPLNNNIENLRYATHKENVNNPNSKQKRVPGKTNSLRKKVKQIDPNTNEIIKIWDSTADAAKALCLNRDCIRHAANGRRNKAGGFKWEYINKIDSIDGEIWKTHPYLGIEVSNKGRVKMVTKGVVRITYGSKHNEYLIIKNKRVNYYVHRLVAETFIPNEEGKPEVNHIDANPLNNCVENLEWVTRSENMRSLETYKKKARPIKSIDKDGNEQFYISLCEASVLTSIPITTISDCCKDGHMCQKGLYFSCVN